MVKILITKRFFFESAHALLGYDGKCKNIHGHSYILEVTVSGEPLVRPNHPKDGMVMDFGDLSSLVKEHIIDVYDHSLFLNEKHREQIPEELFKQFERVIFFPFQPTSENLVEYFSNILLKLLPDGVALYSIRLYETPTSFAEWRSDLI
ncbi:MAG: 6-carboxytetrahydropterin synthase [Bacteroidales bacterium]|nr:6-carboxytetrahydropterin synthase [Bacteroidales bacterium]